MMSLFKYFCFLGSFLVCISCSNSVNSKAKSDAATYVSILKVIWMSHPEEVVLPKNTTTPFFKVIESIDLTGGVEVLDYFYFSSQNFADECIDPWGNDYLFHYSSCEDDYKSDQFPCGKIFVWSIGKNSVNEFGKGDDIMSDLDFNN